MAAEFVYQNLLDKVEAQDQNIGRLYSISVTIGLETIYTLQAPASQRNDTYAFNNTYTVLEPPSDRRVQVTFNPSDLKLSNDRRSMPELALVAGIGISFLLGLSMHLARRAAAGQRARRTLP